MDGGLLEGARHKWKVFGKGTQSQTYVLADVPFVMEGVPKEVRSFVERLIVEEILGLFVKFGRVVKAYAAMKQPHVHGKHRHVVGSDGLPEVPQGESRATRNALSGLLCGAHQCQKSPCVASR